MPYIRASVAPKKLGVGRTARNVSFQTDTLEGWVGEVDEVLPGEVEIDEQTYISAVAANNARNAAAEAAAREEIEANEAAIEAAFVTATADAERVFQDALSAIGDEPSLSPEGKAAIAAMIKSNHDRMVVVVEHTGDWWKAL